MDSITDNNQPAKENQTQFDPETENLELRSKTRAEVALEYNISTKTLQKWFKRHNLEIPAGVIDPYHLRLIYQACGIPAGLIRNQK